jgi:hypothetical protein
LKSLGDDDDSSSVPFTIEPPLTAEDFKQQEDARRVSRHFIISRLNTFGVSPSATTVLIAPPAILSPHASRHQLSSVYFGWQSCPRLLSCSVYFNCRSCQSEPPGLGSRLSRPADNGVSIALDDLEPLGLGSRPSPSSVTDFAIPSQPPAALDSHLSINDDHGIDAIPSKPPGLSSCLSILIGDPVIAIKDDTNGIDLIPSQPPVLGSRLLINDDHGIDVIPSQPPALARLSINDDNGIDDAIPSKPPGLSSRLSISIGDLIIAIKDDTNGINLIPNHSYSDNRVQGATDFRCDGTFT